MPCEAIGLFFTASHTSNVGKYFVFEECLFGKIKYTILIASDSLVCRLFFRIAMNDCEINSCTQEHLDNTSASVEERLFDECVAVWTVGSRTL